MREIYEFEGFRVDVRRRLLTRAGQNVPLTPKAFETLLVLVRSGGRLMTKDEIISEVWPDTFVEEGNLSQNIFLLRRALAEARGEHRFIVTVPGSGYLFVPQVQVPDAAVTACASVDRSVGSKAVLPFKPLVKDGMIATINPATGELLRSFEPHSGPEVEEKLRLASEAFRAYRRVSFAARGEMLLRVAGLLGSRKDRYSRLITTEMGKPIAAAVREIEKAARVCRYYASEAERVLGPEQVATAALESYVRYEPLGPVLAVMPWNFPFWQVLRVAASALMAGNVLLLKHSSNVPQCALELEELFLAAGFPKGTLQTLLVGSDRVAGLIADPRVAAVTLTGSDAAGSSVAAEAARHIKKTVMELGGSDPFIVMPSADLDEAVKTGVRARVLNSGQSCLAAKRFIIADEIYDDFEQRFVAAMRSLRVGDPFDEATDVGPLATEQVLRELDAQVQDALEAGARLLLGGERLRRPGFYYAPSVLANVPTCARAHQEELFGPVALLFRARDAEDAIRLANKTPFGLGASAWTNDRREAERFIEEIEAGLVFINGLVTSDPRLPFGGVKRSGYGRELGPHGLREFVNAKTVWLQSLNPLQESGVAELRAEVALQR